MSLLFSILTIVGGICYIMYKFGHDNFGSGWLLFYMFGSLLAGPIITLLIFGESYLVTIIGGVWILSWMYWFPKSLMLIGGGKDEEKYSKIREQIEREVEITDDDLRAFEWAKSIEVGHQSYVDRNELVKMMAWWKYVDENGETRYYRKSNINHSQIMAIRHTMPKCYSIPTESELKTIQEMIYARTHQYYTIDSPQLKLEWYKRRC